MHVRTEIAAANKKAGVLLRAFKEKNQSVTCKEPKGIGTAIVLRECNDRVKDAVALSGSLKADC